MRAARISQISFGRAWALGAWKDALNAMAVAIMVEFSFMTRIKNCVALADQDLAELISNGAVTLQKSILHTAIAKFLSNTHLSDIAREQRGLLALPAAS